MLLQIDFLGAPQPHGLRRRGRTCALSCVYVYVIVANFAHSGEYPHEADELYYPEDRRGSGATL